MAARVVEVGMLSITEKGDGKCGCKQAILIQSSSMSLFLSLSASRAKAATSRDTSPNVAYGPSSATSTVYAVGAG